MRKARIKKAELMARKLARENELNFLPCNITKIINSLGLTVVYDSFKLLGAIVDVNCGLIIVDNSCPYEQQRFNIAHEIAHFVLKHQGSRFKTSKNPQTIKAPYEQEADAFASELLIPSTKIKSIGYKNNYDVMKLKQLFAVSEKAMAYKLCRLKLPFRNTRYDFDNFFYS